MFYYSRNSLEPYLDFPKLSTKLLLALWRKSACNRVWRDTDIKTFYSTKAASTTTTTEHSPALELPKTAEPKDEFSQVFEGSNRQPNNEYILIVLIYSS
jgi:hypothetical protein